MHQLGKKDKKVARLAIDKGLDTEFKTGIELAKTVISEWESNSLDNRQAYHKLYKTIKEYDKHIAARYDGLGGSLYLPTVTALLYDEVISAEDIKDFSEETKAVLNQTLSTWKNME